MTDPLQERADSIAAGNRAEELSLAGIDSSLGCPDCGAAAWQKSAHVGDPCYECGMPIVKRGRPRPDYDPRIDWPERYGRV